jgi:glycerol uptake facilitator-like aquaporin
MFLKRAGRISAGGMKYHLISFNITCPYHFSVYTVFATIDIPVVGGGALGVFPIAMSVMVAHLFLLPIDGCSINPSRSFGPSLIAAMAGIEGTYYHQQYM